MRNHRDLVATSIAAGICAAIILVIPVEGVRIPAALGLCLFLVGYALTAAIFARLTLEWTHRLLLSLALSLATLVISSLLLHLSPGGLQTGSWTGLLLGITLAAALIAARRREPAAGGTGLRGPAAGGTGLRGPRVSPIDAALVTCALAIAAVAAVIALTPLPAQDAVGYTRLWALPAEEVGGGSVRIGIASAEQDLTAYRLEVRVGGEERPLSSSLALAPGQERVLEISVERRSNGSAVRVSATLYRLTRPGPPYRRVESWVQ